MHTEEALQHMTRVPVNTCALRVRQPVNPLYSISAHGNDKTAMSERRVKRHIKPPRKYEESEEGESTINDLRLLHDHIHSSISC